MGFTVFTAEDGRVWEINRDALYSVVRAAERARIARQHTRVVEHDHGFLMPTTYEVVTDWGAVNRETDGAAARMYSSIEADAVIRPGVAVPNLALMVETTSSDQRWLRETQRDAVSRGMRNIHDNVANWETAVETARFIRDLSATTLVALAAVPTGGGSLAAAGWTTGARVTALSAGSLLRGNATYQDTGNVGAALINGSGTFVVGAMGLGPANASHACTLLIVQSGAAGTATGLQSMVEGRSLESALIEAGVSAGTNWVGGQVGSTRFFEGLSIPVQMQINIGMDTGGSALGNAVQQQFSTTPRASASGAPRSSSPPTISGVLTHCGVPQQRSEAETFIRRNVLRPR